MHGPSNHGFSLGGTVRFMPRGYSILRTVKRNIWDSPMEELLRNQELLIDLSGQSRVPWSAGRGIAEWMGTSSVKIGEGNCLPYH